MSARRGAVLLAALATAIAAGARATPAMRPPQPATAPDAIGVVGDAIPAPLTSEPASASRGRTLLVARDAANCILCHAVPDPAIQFAGNVGPSLAGVGARLSAGQLRLRIADSERLNPATIMPSYYRTKGLDRVARQYRGEPILTAQEVEDLVAYLRTLR